MNPEMAHGLELTVRAPRLHPVLPLNISLGWLARAYSRPEPVSPSATIMALVLPVLIPLMVVSVLVLRQLPVTSLPTD